ncbi:hypothetical protein C8Q78DRAFT_1071468 [Trametes maxima]|nr:hypothetical protein C8Q78DRAFT_1071468 [Trametes maxima]
MVLRSPSWIDRHRPSSSNVVMKPSRCIPISEPKALSRDNWSPYKDRVQFETAELLYGKAKMSIRNINKLLDLWAASLAPHGAPPPFQNSRELYATIDSTSLGAVKWESFNLTYPIGLRPQLASEVPSWMEKKYDVWYRDVHDLARNILSNPDFSSLMDFGPIRVYDANTDRKLGNFMSADWAWSQADIISTYPDSHGSMFVPIILGSDKTTVSIATGHNEYYPLYLSIGNIYNSARRAHGSGLVLAAFLAIPKTERKYDNDLVFRKFRRQLFHTSLSRILRSLKAFMTSPDVVLCGDGHYRKVFYGLGPYIADYPEQALLTCVVQNWCPISRDHTEELVEKFELELGKLWDEYGIIGDIVPFTNDFPRADIYELIAPDILHQLIKGTFKDHLVSWVESYLIATLGKTSAADIMTDIDRRISVVPQFSGLRRFHEGRNFKQWTGDDSKALMKVYLPAIKGHLPSDAVRALRGFLEFCYIIRRETHTPRSLSSMRDALQRFHTYREVFRIPGVRPDGFSLPRQHSCVHYEDRIWAFAAPVSLCSLITESKHITAVKEPWRRSNRFEALGQMLLTNQHMDNLSASRTHFQSRGMFDSESEQEPRQPERGCNGVDSQANEALGRQGATTRRPDAQPQHLAACDARPKTLSSVLLASTAQRGYPKFAEELGQFLKFSELPDLIRRFLFHHLNPDDPESGAALPLARCPPFSKQHIKVYHSTEAQYYASSDSLSGLDGMHHEHICSTPSWRRAGSRHDCVFINRDSRLKGLLGMDVARVMLFFSFRYQFQRVSCTLVHWFLHEGEFPDEDTGMWTVRPRYLRGRRPMLSVVHLDTIFRAAHLIGVSDTKRITDTQSANTALDDFDRYYVNKYIDHHAFEVLHVE